MSKILVTKPSMPSYEEYCAEIKDIWDSRWLTNFGSKHQELEKKLCDYLEVDNITLFVNGHASLEAVLAVYDFPKGSEVITTPFTFVSTTHSITRNGLVPVFCDIRSDNYTLDPEKIEDLITDKTVAIMPVHVYGNVCDVDKISGIAKKYGLKVIYDAAHAFGIKHKGMPVCCYGDASIFSFHATKVFNTIEGGAVFVNERDLKGRLKSFSDFGMTDEFHVGSVGMNAKMNEFQAAMGLCNLRYATENIYRRKMVYERYCQRLADVDGLILNTVSADTVSNYAYYPVVVRHESINRDMLAEKLAENDIYVRKYFYPAVNRLEPYISHNEATPVSDDVSERVLSLPLYSDLSLAEVDRICDVIVDYFSESERK